MLRGKVSRRRQPGFRGQSAFENGEPQFAVEPARESLIASAGAQRKFITADGFRQTIPLGPEKLA